jgi:hypothetical protein
VVVAVLGGMSAIGMMHLVAAADLVTPGTPEPAPLVLTLEQDRLSAKFSKRSLAEVLAALDAQMPLRVYYRGSHAAALRETTISATFDKLPLLEGVKRLLDGQNYTLRYKPARASTAAGTAPGGDVLHIWLMSGTGDFNVLKSGEAPLLSTADQDQEEQSGQSSVSDLITAALTHPDNQVRWKATEELQDVDGFTKNQQIVDALWQIMRTDSDPEVRESALDGLAELEDLPFAPIAEVFRTDQHELVRTTALIALARRHGQAAQEVVQQALQDSSYYVRKHAEAMLRELSIAQGQSAGTQKPAREQKTNGTTK